MAEVLILSYQLTGPIVKSYWTVAIARGAMTETIVLLRSVTATSGNHGFLFYLKRV
ncbi:hypothetical protein LGMK_08210 [Leuconostoc sp. C2]|nr:hypothetical protein LGMK_08210 [Leuconostoc sp. C2]